MSTGLRASHLYNRDLTNNGVDLSPWKWEGSYNFKNRDHIAIPNLSVAGATGISVSFWMNGDNSFPWASTLLSAFTIDGNRAMNIHLPWSNENIYWDCGNTGGSYNRINKTLPNSTYYKNQWRHYVLRKNVGAGTMDIYIDGTLFHSGTGLTHPINDMYHIHLPVYWSGYIEEFRIYDTEISLADISSLYSSNTSTATPLVRYRFNETDATSYGSRQNIKDDSYNNYKSEIYGDAQIVAGPNGSDAGLRLEGGGQYARIYDEVDEGLNVPSYTIEMWVKRLTNNNHHVLWSNDYTTHAEPYYSQQLRISASGAIYFGWNNNGVAHQGMSTANGEAPLYTWVHVAVTFVTGKQEIWVNGSRKVDYSYAHTIAYFANATWIGRANYAITQGIELAHIRLWDRVLSSSEITNAMNGSVESISGYATSIRFRAEFDNIRISNLGSLGASWDGIVGGCVPTFPPDHPSITESAFFEEGNSYMDPVEDPKTSKDKKPFGEFNEISISAWICPMQSNDERAPIVRGDRFYSQVRRVPGTLDYRLETYWYGRNPAGYHSSGARTVTTGTWQHIAIVWSTTQVKFYINGELTNTVSSTGTGDICNWIYLGYESGSRRYRGVLSHVHLFNREISGTEVTDLYNGIMMASAAIGYWPMGSVDSLHTLREYNYPYSDPSIPWVNDAGTWKLAKRVWVRNGGSWKLIHGIPKNMVIMYESDSYAVHPTNPSSDDYPKATVLTSWYGRLAKVSSYETSGGVSSIASGSLTAGHEAVSSYTSPKTLKHENLSSGYHANGFTTHTHTPTYEAHSYSGMNIMPKNRGICPTLDGNYIGIGALFLYVSSSVLNDPRYTDWTSAYHSYMIAFASGWNVTGGLASNLASCAASSGHTLGWINSGAYQKSRRRGISWIQIHDHIVFSHDHAIDVRPAFMTVGLFRVNERVYTISELPIGTHAFFTDQSLPDGWTYVSGAQNRFLMGDTGGKGVFAGDTSKRFAPTEDVTSFASNTTFLEGNEGTDEYRIDDHRHIFTSTHTQYISMNPLYKGLVLGRKDS